MFTSSFSRFLTVCSALAATGTAVATPFHHQPHLRAAAARSRTPLRRSDGIVPSGPKFVVYSQAPLESGAVLPDVSQIQGFNVFNLAFLLSTGPHDQAAAWAALPAEQRQSLKATYNGAGVALVVSAFGATERPATAGLDPAALAQTMADFVQSTDLDGLDADWEELEIMVQQPGVGERWLVTFTQVLRTRLPQGQFIISHAPVAPWFEPTFCPGGGYLEVDRLVGPIIDWYNVQFYNQSPYPGYETCDSLISSGGGSSVMEIAASGVDKSKIVIGKPAGMLDQTNGGYMNPATLSMSMAQAKAQGWDAGVMAYQYPRADATWISTVKGTTFA